MSTPGLQEVWEAGGVEGLGGADSCELMGELSSLMVGVAAALTRVQRRLPATDGRQEELQQIDEAFAIPIALARKLAVAVHATHDCSRSSRSVRR